MLFTFSLDAFWKMHKAILPSPLLTDVVHLVWIRLHVAIHNVTCLYYVSRDIDIGKRVRGDYISNYSLFIRKHDLYVVFQRMLFLLA